MIWKKIEIIGFEDRYLINDFGEIKSIWYRKKIKPELINSGYLRVTLTKNGKSIRKCVHVLTALTFIENPFKKTQVNHLNGIKSDNRIDNLEWCTNKENCIHAVKIGLHKNQAKGEKQGNSKLTEKQVRIIKHALNYGVGAYKLGKIFNIKGSCIALIKLGINWKHIKV